MKKILVTGCKGQLGYDIANELERRNIIAIRSDITEMDITDFSSVNNFIKKNSPDAVIHCAAWTAVDKAEDEAALCTKVNVEGTKNIAVVCKELDIPMMYFSTDYVFSGEGVEPFKINDKKGPKSVYGKTKLDGEEEILKLLTKYYIVRISWVFGINGNNFIKTMLKLSENHQELKVVSDQIGSPTYTYDLAPLLCDMIVSGKFGIYHATNEGYTSWSDFAKKIFEVANKNVNVIPVTTEEYGISKAARPKNSRLDKSSLDENGFKRLPSWEDALNRYIKELKIN